MKLRDLIKAVAANLIPQVKTVNRKGKVFTQTYHVKLGEEVKYKRPDIDKNWRTGTVVGTSTGHIHVEGKREAGSFKPKVHKIPVEHVQPVEMYKYHPVKPKDKKYTAEGDRTKATRNTTSAELRKRGAIVEKRLGIKEAQILQHPSFIGPAIKIVAGLAKENGISTAMTGKPSASLWHQAADADYQDMLFHYSMGALKAWRRELSKPLDKQVKTNVKEFQAVLENERKSSYTHYVMEKEGKAAAIQFLKERRKDRDAIHDQDIHDMVEDPAARALLDKNSSQPMQLKYTLAVNKETFRDDMKKILAGMQPVEREAVKLKFGFGAQAAEMLNNEEVADRLNAAGHRDGKNKWTRNSVGTLMAGVIDKIRNSPMKDALSFHYDALLGRDVWKSIPDLFEHMLMKSEVENMPQPTKTICVDFDGVIADYSKGFQGENVFGLPLPGASDGMKQLKKDGWRVIIFTCRPATPQLAAYLATHQIPYDGINVAGDGSPKPAADLYLDDRGLRFYNWTQALEEIGPRVLEKSETGYVFRLAALVTRFPRELHPEGLFKAGDHEYEIRHEGDEAVLVKGSFDDLLQVVNEERLRKSAIEELEAYLSGEAR